MWMKRTLYVSCLWIAAGGAAAAQAPPVATPPAEITPPVTAAGSKDCGQMQPAPQPGTIAPEGSTTGQSREPLGDRLAKSDGVLCPPSGVDPQIRLPTPDAGNTPVIPPPGSPGGDPRVRPK
jgi:hypothetical protein